MTITEHEAKVFDAIAYRIRMRASYDSPVTGCANCVTPARGKKEYCDLHRCHAVRRNGKRCLYVVPWGRDTYCTLHGCNFLLAHGVFCDELHGTTGQCEPHRIERAEQKAKLDAAAKLIIAAREK